MKRVTYWPQAWLGILANWGLVIAWLAVHRNRNNRDTVPTLMLGLWW